MPHERLVHQASLYKSVKEKEHSNSGSRVLLGNARPLGNRRLSPLSKKQAQHQEHENRRECRSRSTAPKQVCSRNTAVFPESASQKILKGCAPATGDDDDDNNNDGTLRSTAPFPSLKSGVTISEFSQAVGCSLGSSIRSFSHTPLCFSSPKANDSVHEAEGTCTKHHISDEKEDELLEDVIFGQAVTDDLLRQWTGWEDLHLVLNAEFRVDAISMAGIDTFSSRMPLLHSLKLNNSRIPQIRLLGTRFMNLKRLWIGSSQVENLRGIRSCAPNLEEIYASFNYVSDITPLLDLSETLEVVDLEGNEIRDAALLRRCLPLMEKVKYLTLQGNPVAMAQPNTSLMTGEEEGGSQNVIHFREFVQSLMSNLQYLDDIAVDSPSFPDSLFELSSPSPMPDKDHQNSIEKSPEKKQSSTHVDPLQVSFSDEYMFLQQCIRECSFDPLKAALAEETREVYSRPRTSCAGARRRCPTSKSEESRRPSGSSRKVCHALEASECLVGHEAGSSVDPHVTSACRTSPQSLCISSLTSGPLVVGGPISLRRRHCLPPLPISSTPSTVDTCLSSDITLGISLEGGSMGHKSENANLPLGMTESSASKPASVKVPAKWGGEQTPSVSSYSPENGLETLFFDDDNDEWELYKHGLIRSVQRRSTDIQRWVKYLAGDSAAFSNNNIENGMLFSLSPSTPTQMRSDASNLSALHGSYKAQTDLASLTMQPLATSQQRQVQEPFAETKPETFDELNSELPSGGRCITPDEAQAEDEWRKELVRSVSRVRIKTMRAAMDEKSVDKAFITNTVDVFGASVVAGVGLTTAQVQ